MEITCIAFIFLALSALSYAEDEGYVCTSTAYMRAWWFCLCVCGRVVCGDLVVWRSHTLAGILACMRLFNASVLCLCASVYMCGRRITCVRAHTPHAHTHHTHTHAT